MQRQAKEAAIVCAILTPILFWFGMRVGSLCNTQSFIDSISYALDNVINDILNNPIFFTVNNHSITLGLISIIGIWAIWMILFGIPIPEMVGKEHGTARWATIREMRKFMNLKERDNNILLSKSTGLATKRDGYSLEYDRNLNVAVIGGSGSGKTRYYVKPNLMQLHGNYFVTDPKGTVVDDCRAMLENNGYEIKCFNVIPDKMHESMCFNPLYYIKTKEEILAFVNCLIKNTTPKDSVNNDPFWEKSEIMLYVAVLSLMQDWFDDEEFTLPNLAHYIGLAEAKEEDEDWESPLDLIYKEIETGYMYVEINSKEAMVYAKLSGQNIGEENFVDEDVQVHGDNGGLFNIVGAEYNNKSLKAREGYIAVPSDIKNKTTGKSPWEIFVNSNGTVLPKSNKNDYSVLRYKEFKAAAGKTLKSIIIQCNTRLLPITIPKVSKILEGKSKKVKKLNKKTGKYEVVKVPTGVCELELDKLGDKDKKMCVFAIMSDTNDTFFFLVAVMMYQVMDILCNRALTKYGGKLPKFVHFIFDEFANLGYLKDFDRTIAITRSRNIGISLILQTPFQLRHAYEENAAKVILDNCDTMVYLGGGNDGADISTCKEISARLGKQTIHTRNVNINKGSNGNTGLHNQVQQRDLMLPDEVARMPREQEIILIKNTHPYKDKKFVLEKHRRWKLL